LGLAFGAEWREETSKAQFAPLRLGVIPEGTPFAAGTLVDTVSDNGTLGFDGDTKLLNTDGRYDVSEVFTEVEIPLLRDVFLADELTVNAAFRYSDYSTIGSADARSGNVQWAPIAGVRFRGTRSRAVRAPNIFELFSPDQAATFRPTDPCVQAEIDALAMSNAAQAALRAANCAAAGIPAGFTDPLCPSGEGA
ncbi:MAG TPA: TonB-dependent receptor, partial [Steroidobacteraceae bacterium]|nr:TonB-dependent receptor [Steroidobacteraceae bacterium]